jgi:hypothetical protein
MASGDTSSGALPKTGEAVLRVLKNQIGRSTISAGFSEC